MKERMNEACPTGYPFGRRLASFFVGLGWLVTFVFGFLCVVSIVKVSPGGAQAFIPLVGGLFMVLTGHMAIAVFNTSDLLLGQHVRGDRRDGST